MKEHRIRNALQIDGGVDPATRRDASRWSDLPTHSDFIDHARNGWVDRYNQELAQGRWIAAAGELLAGRTREGFMTRYEISGTDRVATPPAPGATRIFQGAQIVWDLAKDVLKKKDKKKKKPKGSLIRKIARARQAMRDAKERRDERIQDGRGLLSRFAGSVWPDSFRRHLAEEEYLNQWGDRDQEPDQQRSGDEQNGPDAPDPAPEVDSPDPSPDLDAPEPSADVDGADTSADGPDAGESQAGENGQQEGMPEWVRDALARHFAEQQAAEQAQRARGAVDNEGRFVVDGEVVEQSVQDPDGTQAYDPEPQVADPSDDDIAEQEAANARNKDTRPSKRTKTK